MADDNPTPHFGEPIRTFNDAERAIENAVDGWLTEGKIYFHQRMENINMKVTKKLEAADAESVAKFELDEKLRKIRILEVEKEAREAREVQMERERAELENERARAEEEEQRAKDMLAEVQRKEEEEKVLAEMREEDQKARALRERQLESQRLMLEQEALRRQSEEEAAERVKMLQESKLESEQRRTAQNEKLDRQMAEEMQKREQREQERLDAAAQRKREKEERQLRRKMEEERRNFYDWPRAAYERGQRYLSGYMERSSQASGGQRFSTGLRQGAGTSRQDQPGANVLVAGLENQEPSGTNDPGSSGEPVSNSSGLLPGQIGKFPWDSSSFENMDNLDEATRDRLALSATAYPNERGTYPLQGGYDESYGKGFGLMKEESNRTFPHC